MKFYQIPLALGFALLTLTSQAGLKDRDNKIYRCVFEIAQSKQINLEVANDLSSILLKVGSAPNKELMDQCESIADQALELPPLAEVEALKLFPHQDDPFSLKGDQIAHRLLAAAVKDGLECRFVGADIDVAMVKAVGVGINIGTCTGVTGKIYRIIVPEADYGQGIGAMATIGYTKFHLKKDQTVYHDGQDMEFIIALGIAGGTTLVGSSEHYSGGVGLGIITKRSISAVLKLDQMGRSFRHVRNELKKREN